MIALVLATLLCPLRPVSTNSALQKSVTSVPRDNSVNSVSRLYNVNPAGLYASASPYGAYSLYAPTYVPDPQSASSRIVPVKEENVIVHKSNGYLKDSYGNRFIESPQSFAYKTIFPQQYVQLQDLPAHLAQPLSVAGPSYTLKQQLPQYYYASPQVTALHTLPSVTHFMRNPQSIIYGANIKGPTPSATHHIQSHNIQHYGNGKHSQRPQSTASTSSAPQQLSSGQQAVLNIKNAVHKPEIKYQLSQKRPHRIETPTSFSRNTNYEAVKKSPTTQSITTTVNGKKTVINIDTKPPLPLLDLSLLEPLTFANPVVPQIQHLLPRIPSATYHKLPAFDVEAKKHDDEFVVTNTRSYDSGTLSEPQDEDSSENNENAPQTSDEDRNLQDDEEEREQGSTSADKNKPAHNFQSDKSPNYKEVNNEKVISYVKTTQNEPKHYSYSKDVPQQPVNYSYTKNIEQKPINYSNKYSTNRHINKKEIDYDNEDRTPKQLIYEFKSNKPSVHDNVPQNEPSPSQLGSVESENSSESNEEETIRPTVQTHYNERPRQFVKTTNLRPEHRQEIRQSPVYQKEQFPPIQYLKLEPMRPPIRIQVQHVVPPEYKENIRFQPLTKSHAAIKVNPNQHIEHKTPAPHISPRPNKEQSRKPTPQFHSTAKHVIIKDESPEEKHVHQEQMMKEEMNHEENSEEDFENSYKNAAYGFPAFDKKSEEETVFDPESYGIPQYHSNYNIEDNPFQQYQTEGDEYPKSMRLSYKDSNDKNKENYYLDYSINKPESLVDEYQNKIDYYKMLRNHKKDNYFPSFDDNQKEKPSKYVAASYGFESDQQPKRKKQNEYRSAEPQFYEYNYSKEAPRDNSAHPTHANLRTKSKTQFVEPQFQYGFEPLSLPSLLDSELSAVASNNSPKTESPDYKKKTYKENLYIKKTNSSSGKSVS